MNKQLQRNLTILILVLFFITTPYFIFTYAQSVTGCFILNQNNLNIPIPPQCQNNSGSPICNNVTEKDNLSYNENGHTVFFTMWECDHQAPLVVFVPGQSRSAADYARYEQAIASKGFTVAGINFSTSENDGKNFDEEVTDVKSLIDQLIKDSKFQGGIDKSKGVGLVGHSDGGNVVLMEGYKGSNDSNVKAIIGADGSEYPGETHNGPPLFIVAGQKDMYVSPSTTTSTYQGLKTYSNPTYLAILTNADHFCYVTQQSVPGYPINCAQNQATLQPETDVLDAFTIAFLQDELYGCGDSMSNIYNQDKSAVTTFQLNGNTTFSVCTTGGTNSIKWPFKTKDPTQFRRVDQGWDLQGSSPQIVYAVAAGTVYKANNDPSGFGDYYPYEKLEKPIPGSSLISAGYTSIYYGHIHYADGGKHYGVQTPNVLGKKVQAGDIIGYTYPGCCWPANWLEIGFGDSAPVGQGSFPTQAGLDMEYFLNGTKNDYSGTGQPTGK